MSKGLVTFNRNMQTTFKYFYKKIDSTTDDITILKQLIEKCENKIERILHNEDFYELFYWSRRIRPYNVFNIDNITYNGYREVYNLAIKKYTILDSSSIFFNTEYAMPNYLTVAIEGNKMHADKITDAIMSKSARALNKCYLLEKLCYYLSSLNQDYRKLSKGGWLEIDTEEGITVKVNEEIQKMIDLYDERLSHSNLFSYAGANINYNFNNQNKAMMLSFFLDNYSNINLGEFMVDDRINIPNQTTNFIPFAVSLNEFYGFASNYSNEFKNYYGFTIDTYLAFVYSINMSNMVMLLRNPNRLQTLCMRAYTIYKIENLLDDLDFLMPDILKITNLNVKEIDLEEIPAILDFIELSADKQSDISLTTSQGGKAMIHMKESLGLLDYRSFLDFVSNILDPITKEEDTTGDLFEQQVVKTITEVFGHDCIVAEDKMLKINANNKREIDIAFVYDDVLFILECKSVNVSLGFFRGDSQSVEFRNRKNKKAIEQSNKTSKFINDNFEALREKYAEVFPTNIKSIASLIVSIQPEYIWSDSDELFISPNLPRILTPSELKVLKEINISDSLQGKPFSIDLE